MAAKENSIPFTEKHLRRLSQICSWIDLLGTLSARVESDQQRREVARLYKRLSDESHTFFQELRELFRFK